MDKLYTKSIISSISDLIKKLIDIFDYLSDIFVLKTLYEYS
jgi:hypothetical protein